MTDSGLDHELMSDTHSGLDQLMMIQRCDSINLDGMQKPLSEERGTYGHAQKMHASMTYMFGRLQGLGNMWWHESDVGGGVMVGNPSISTEVSSFMCSLRHRKVTFFFTLILTSLSY